MSLATRDDDAAVARRIAALAHEELALVREGRHEDLAGLAERRSEAMALLPVQLSAAAREALLEALDVQRRVSEELTTELALTRAELGRITRGRAAVNGYAPAGMDQRPVLDQTA